MTSLMNYPTHLSAPSDFVIAQISDLHLSKHDLTTRDKFLVVLELALQHQPNLLLLTGDLVNDGEADLYDWLFARLNDTHLPFLCMAGNHDVTQEIGHGLPFNERTFLPICADERLVDNHRLLITLPDATWQILTVNTAVGGQAYGNISPDGLAFLSHHLSDPLPTLIALHHHPLPVGSAWMDKLMLQNADAFWHIVQPHPQVRAVLSGHVHQACAKAVPLMADCTFYTTPATARQFLPLNDDFALDTMAGGFRLMTLHGNTLSTRIVRL